MKVYIVHTNVTSTPCFTYADAKKEFDRIVEGFDNDRLYRRVSLTDTMAEFYCEKLDDYFHASIVHARVIGSDADRADGTV